MTRFSFADGNDGRWSTARASAYASNGPIACPIGGYVYFYWEPSMHDLVRMASASHLAACDFSGSTTLVPVGGVAANGYYLPCASAGESIHLACSVSDHCSAGGQKLSVHVSSTVHAISPTDGATLLHSDSLGRVMTLLGYRQDGASGFTYLDRGYQTEEAAEASLELIWCLEAHCPDSARDVDADATEASCKAEIHNLGGFVSRKRPTPQLAHSEAYYLEALSFEPNHCPTLGYLAELYLTKSNATAAAATAARLCLACGLGSTAALQASASFDEAGKSDWWPCGKPPSPPPAALLSPPPPPSPLPPLAPLPRGSEIVHTVSTRLTIDATLETFDRDGFKVQYAAAAGVGVDAVALQISSGSIVVVAVVTAANAASAASIARTIETVTASPAALSASLGVVVIAAEPPVVELTVVPTRSEGAPSGGGESNALVVIQIGCGVAVALVLVAVATCAARRHQRTALRDREQRRVGPAWSVVAHRRPAGPPKGKLGSPTRPARETEEVGATPPAFATL